jgi:hypothetical protein
MQNDPSAVRFPGWSGQYLTINNPFFSRSIRSVVRSTGRKSEKNPVAETRCVGQAGRGSHYYCIYYYFYYNLALGTVLALEELGTVLALEELCCSLERRFSVLCQQTWSDPPARPIPMFGFRTYTLTITDYLVGTKHPATEDAISPVEVSSCARLPSDVPLSLSFCCQRHDFDIGVHGSFTAIRRSTPAASTLGAGAVLLHVRRFTVVVCCVLSA